jgi:hypothetical protein
VAEREKEAHNEQPEIKVVEDELKDVDFWERRPRALWRE